MKVVLIIRRMYAITVFGLLLIASIVSQPAAGAGDAFGDIKVTPEKIVLAVKNKFTDEVEIEKSADVNDDIIAENCSDLMKVELELCEIESNKLKVKLKDSYFNTQPVTLHAKLSFTNTNTNIKETRTVEIEIPARITLVRIEIDGTQAETYELIEEDKKTVSVTYRKDGVEASDFVLESSDNEKVHIPGDKDIEAIRESAGLTVNIQSATDNGFAIGSFKVNVKPRISEISFVSGNSLSMSENDNHSIEVKAKRSDGSLVSDLSTIECKPDATLESSVPRSELANNKLLIDVETIPKNSEKRINGKITCAANYAKDTELGHLTLTIYARTGHITVESLNGNTLLPNGSLNFLTRVFQTSGAKSDASIEYVLENKSENQQWVSLSPQGEKLTVNWVNLPRDASSTRPAFVNIKVISRASATAEHPIYSEITVHMASVAKFASLKVKLNLMDERTASDLYGNVTKDEYHVLMVRLFNDLKDRDANRYTGESILAYSSSIEVAVELEKKFDGDSNSGNFGAIFDKNQMKEIELLRKQKGFETFKESLASLDETFKEEFNRFQALIKESIKREKEALQLETEARNNRYKREAARRARSLADQTYDEISALRNKLRNLYRYSLITLPQIPLPDNVAINDGKWYSAGREDLMQIERQEDFLSPFDDDSNVSISDNEPNCVDTITYRPFTFEMMVNTVDRRDERTLRSRIFKLLNLASFGMSTITSVAVPAKSSDLPLGIEKFGNVLIPGLEELFPNLKEQHRQNIVSQTMKPIEEIPFGADITRVIFIPKKPIKGLISGHKARISQICPFYFKVKVAVISKGGEVILGNQIP
mgnify:CR=1 FL=1